MSFNFNEKYEEKIMKRIARTTKRIKGEEDFEIVEEVFDRETLMTLYRLINAGFIEKFFGAVATGKEAKVYWAQDPKGEDIAVKIFLKETSDFKKSIIRYIDGDPRFRRTRKDIRYLIKLWCGKEFKNLKEVYSVGVKVPKPITFLNNVLVMEFVGENGVPAPLMKEKPPENPEKAYNIIMKYIERAVVNAKIVHADLSEYNILNHNEELYIIDWGSAVHISHPMAFEFLKRDIKNINFFFRRLGVKVVSVEEAFRHLVKMIK